jgi:hypothetical protein
MNLKRNLSFFYCYCLVNSGSFTYRCCLVLATVTQMEMKLVHFHSLAVTSTALIPFPLRYNAITKQHHSSFLRLWSHESEKENVLFYYYYCLINSGSFTYSSVFYFMDIWYLHLCFLILHLYFVLFFFCKFCWHLYLEKSSNICISLGCTKYIQPSVPELHFGAWAKGPVLARFHPVKP